MEFRKIMYDYVIYLIYYDIHVIHIINQRLFQHNLWEFLSQAFKHCHCWGADGVPSVSHNGGNKGAMAWARSGKPVAKLVYNLVNCWLYGGYNIN